MPPSVAELKRFCVDAEPCLVHLYRSSRSTFFEACRRDYDRGGGWTFVATPGHGIEKPVRPTVNFFFADRDFLAGYDRAFLSRGFEHGVLVHWIELMRLAGRKGFEAAEVRVGHPAGYGVDDRAEFWKFDIGKYRFGAVGELQHATVFRLATPVESTHVDVSRDAVVRHW